MQDQVWSRAGGQDVATVATEGSMGSTRDDAAREGGTDRNKAVETGRDIPGRALPKATPLSALNPGAGPAQPAVPGRDAGTGTPRPARAGAPGATAEPDIGRRILARVVQGNAGHRAARSLERDAIVSVDKDRVRILVPSHFIAEYIGRNFVLALREAAAIELRGRGVKPAEVAVDVVVEPGAFVGRPGIARDSAAGLEVLVDRATSAAAAGAPARPAADREPPVPVVVPSKRPAPNRELRHKLSDFVVGDCNRIAHTAACAVAEGTAPPRFSPMFLYGPSGVGKTHLLQGLAQRAAERLGDRAVGQRVRYTTAETFTNDFVQAIKTNTTDAFRRGFRNVEILCIDDIHFLAGKGATQAEFLHVFDTMGLAGRMVVLASDDSPREIRNLTEALVSRFLSGACIKVDPPDETTRVALIRRLAAARGLMLDDDAVSLLTDRAGRPLPGGSLPSVREIEGLLTRIEATRNFMAPGEFATPGGVIGRSMAARALGLTAADGRSARRPVPASVIIERTCRALRVDATDLMGRGRHARVVLARSLVTLLARKLTTMSYPEIARSMNRPNHSTVITAYNRVTRQIASGQPVEGGPEFEGVSIQSLAERLEREIVAAMGQ